MIVLLLMTEIFIFLLWLETIEVLNLVLFWLIDYVINRCVIEWNSDMLTILNWLMSKFWEGMFNLSAHDTFKLLFVGKFK